MNLNNFLLKCRLHIRRKVIISIGNNSQGKNINSIVFNLIAYPGVSCVNPTIFHEHYSLVDSIKMYGYKRKWREFSAGYEIIRFTGWKKVYCSWRDFEETMSLSILWNLNALFLLMKAHIYRTILCPYNDILSNTLDPAS